MAGKPKQNKKTNQPANPLGARSSCLLPQWHKKHDTLSSSQTTHPQELLTTPISIAFPLRALREQYTNQTTKTSRGTMTLTTHHNQ